MSHSNLIVIRTKSPLLRFSGSILACFRKIRLKVFLFDESGIQNCFQFIKNCLCMAFDLHLSPQRSDAAIGKDDEG